MSRQSGSIFECRSFTRERTMTPEDWQIPNVVSDRDTLAVLILLRPLSFAVIGIQWLRTVATSVIHAASVSEGGLNANTVSKRIVNVGLN